MIVAQTLPYAEALLGSLTTTEMRLAATALIVVLAVGAGSVAVPRVVDRLDGAVAARRERWEGRSPARIFERANERLPLRLIVRIFVGVVQVGLFAVSGLSILLVWGRVDLALAALALFERVVPTLVRAALTVALFLGAYVGSGVLNDVVADFAGESNRVTAHQEQLLLRIAQVSLLAVVVTTALGIWNVNLGGLLVGAGFLGIVVGLAAQQTVGALIAGFILMFSRPFEIGDWVAIGDEEGIVSEITIMNTHVRNFDGEFVVVPNDSVTDRVVTNRTRDGKLRLGVEVGVDYDADLGEACEVALEAVESADGVVRNPRPLVTPASFGDSAVVLDVRFWISPPTPQGRRRATAAVIEGVKRRFRAEGIEIPFPQRVVSERSAPPETDIAYRDDLHSAELDGL